MWGNSAMLKIYLQLVALTVFLSASAQNSTPNDRQPNSVTPANWEELHQDGRVAEAFSLAQQQLSGPKKEFYLGVLAFQAKQWNDSVNYLTQSLAANHDLADYIYLYRGQANRALNEPQKALEDFKKAQQSSRLKFIADVSQFQEAEIYQGLKQWKKAEPIYKKLQKRLARSKYYPAVLWGSLSSQMATKTQSRFICRNAKELYLKYPSFEKVADWGIVLSENMVNGHKLNCVTTFKEQRLRLQRMLWAGMEEKALGEIQSLQKNSSSSTKYLVDELLVTYYLHEGYVDEAQKVLNTYASSKGDDADYLLLVGKVYSRASNPAKSAEAYYKASQSLGGNSASSALFQSGFMSYLAADYKASSQKFTELMSKFPGYRWRADIVWYQAWLKYLQKDFGGAEKDFLAIIEEKSKKPRVWKEHKDDKINYWLAMSYMRQDKKDKAIELFSSLTHDESVGYYSVAAFQRLNQISNRQLASLAGKFNVHENWWLPEALAGANPKDKEEENLVVQQDPFEQKVDALLSTEDKSRDELPEDVVATGPQSKLESDVKAVYMNSIDKSIQRATALIKVGEDELAYREVLETEGQRLTNEQKQWLLKAHQSINSFNRSVVLASYFYSDQVAKLGLYHGSDYWNYSFPKAYEKSVTRYSKQWGTPAELVWSIMRAETIYRPDAISPVGARGLMQVMPKTGRKLASMTGENFEVDDLLKPTVSVKMGSYYLARLMKKFKGNIPLVAAAYNGGPHRVQAWMHYFGGLDMDEFIEHIPFQETRNYAKKVTKYYAIYNLLYNKKTDATDLLSKPIGFKIEGSIPSMETWERYE